MASHLNQERIQTLETSNQLPMLFCGICSDRFQNVKLLMEHVQHHNKDSLTDMSSEEESSVNKHLESDNVKSAGTRRKSTPRFTCAICYVSFTSGSLLVSHVLRHMTDSEDSDDFAMYMCALCHKSFTTNSALVVHVKSHSSACDIEVKAISHEKKEDLSQNKISPIIQINKNDISKSKLIVKLKQTEDVLSFQCEICSKYFKNNVTLTEHMKLHTKNEPGEDSSVHQQSLLCAICNKELPTQTALIDHIRTHPVPKDHHCSSCDKSFNCASHLIRHERIHSGERPFQCAICPSAFSRQSHLTTHNRIHQGERPYVCSVCGKQFTDSSNLVKHNRLHTLEKSYKCDVCDKVFSRSDTLAKHMRSHSGEKPYICDLCARPFPRKDSLNRHLMSHRGEKPHQCIVCEQRFTQKYDLTLHYRMHAKNTTLPNNWSLEGFSEPQRTGSSSESQ